MWRNMWVSNGQKQVCGNTLEYACFGPAPDAAPTWVLLHEGLGCVALWRDFPQKLADQTGWGVLAYSRAGYGQSSSITRPRPLDYMTRHAAQDLPDLLSGLGRFALLGHSDGATIAAIYAGSNAAKGLLGSVLIAPHFFSEDAGLSAIQKARFQYEHGSLRTRLQRYHADVDAAFYGWCDAWLHPDFRPWSVADILPTTQSPLLPIMGDADPYGSLAQVDIVTQTCPTAVAPVILPGSAHAPHLEAADIVLDAVGRFGKTCLDSHQSEIL